MSRILLQRTTTNGSNRRKSEAGATAVSGTVKTTYPHLGRNSGMDAASRDLAADFDIERLTPEFYANPYPTYRALRQHAPVKRMGNGGYFLTRYDDLVAVYKN